MGRHRVFCGVILPAEGNQRRPVFGFPAAKKLGQRAGAWRVLSYLPVYDRRQGARRISSDPVAAEHLREKARGYSSGYRETAKKTHPLVLRSCGGGARDGSAEVELGQRVEFCSGV